jgi:hypothetical protein
MVIDVHAHPDDQRRPLATSGAPEYARTMSDVLRVKRGWIYIDASRQDDGSIKLGTGGEMRFNPVEAISRRQDTPIAWGDILKASVQRLAFWSR